jgi:hypothetical protein
MAGKKSWILGLLRSPNIHERNGYFLRLAAAVAVII